jgi:beta-galactosidase
VTSYDYDAPLDEAGDPTAKFFAFRDVIAKYAPVPDEQPAPRASAPVASVELTPAGAWTDAAASASPALLPATFDELGHLSALVRYDLALPPMSGPGLLTVEEVRDLAWVSVDGQPVGTLSRTRHDQALRIPAGRTLSILVEEQGRVNYDHRLGEEKGLIGAPMLDGAPLGDWTSTPLDVQAIADEVATRTAPRSGDGPRAWTGDLVLDAPADLFLDTGAWSKGYAFVNGFFLGRYWRNGPQRTLFVPAPATRTGANRVVVLELEELLSPRAEFVRGLCLGDTEE